MPTYYPVCVKSVKCVSRTVLGYDMRTILDIEIEGKVLTSRKGALAVPKEGKEYSTLEEYVKKEDNSENKGTKRKIESEVSIERILKDKTIGTIVVILKNPSKADARVSDQSINNVIKYIVNNSTSINRIIILNLIPYYATYLVSFISPTTIPMLINGENIEAIDYILNNYKNVILGWGNNGNTKINSVNEFIKQIVLNISNARSNTLSSVGDLTDEGEPRHPSRNKWVGISLKERTITVIPSPYSPFPNPCLFIS